jgi:CRISPR-associated endoribonuclease Cas6
MLGKIILRLQTEGARQLDFNSGSILHGFLMEITSGNAVDLHSGDGFRAYSQHCYYDAQTNSAIWQINTLNRTSAGIIEHALRGVESIHLKQKGLTYKVVEKSDFVYSSYRELLLSQLNRERAPKYTTLYLKTPCALKFKNQFINFPIVKSIIASLYAKWRTFSEAIDIEQKELVEQIAAGIRISSYKLSSRVFPLERNNIPAFQGWMKLESKLPVVLTALSNTLFLYGEYAGIGSKTALGLGAVKTDLGRDV